MAAIKRRKKPVIVAAHVLEVSGVDGAEMLGIGVVEAALSIGRILAQKPEGVLLVGSCGAYRSDLGIGDVVVGRRFVLAASRGDLGPVSNDVTPPLLPLQGRAVIVATTLSITTDDAEARLVHEKTNADVENLEAFAVATACARESVPFAALLGVTNRVGSRGRAEWRENAERVARIVLEAL